MQILVILTALISTSLSAAQTVHTNEEERLLEMSKPHTPGVSPKSSSVHSISSLNPADACFCALEKVFSEYVLNLHIPQLSSEYQGPYICLSKKRTRRISLYTEAVGNEERPLEIQVPQTSGVSRESSSVSPSQNPTDAYFCSFLGPYRKAIAVTMIIPAMSNRYLGQYTCFALHTKTKYLLKIQDVGNCLSFVESLGLKVSYSAGVRVGSVASFRCQPSTILSGSSYATCHFNRTWSHPPPTCKAICHDPGPLQNGNSEPVVQMANTYYAGSSIEYSCQASYYLVGNRRIFCTENGTWSGPKPTCVKACTDLPVPLGGFVSYFPPRIIDPRFRRSPLENSTLRASSVSASRNTTLELVTVPKLPVTFLEPVTVTDLPGTFLEPVTVTDLQTTFLEPVTVTDLPTTFLEPVTVTDLPTTFLEPVTVTDLPVTFLEPVTAAPPAGMHRVGTRAVFKCESRFYKLIGSRKRKCKETGKWSGRATTCMPLCGISDSAKSPYIVNGNSTRVGQWPWQAAIYVNDHGDWSLHCGGSLLNEFWVVSAAHCFFITKRKIDQYEVHLGKYYTSLSEDDVQVRKVQEIQIHPDFHQGTFDADIALIRLDSPAQFNFRVQPVCLPTEQITAENLIEGRRGVVTGWGKTEKDTYPETLQQAVMPIASKRACKNAYKEHLPDFPIIITNNMFCVGSAQEDPDVCYGDSGGPMVFIDNMSREKKWILEGIVSWGSPRSCSEAHLYSVFTKVSNFLDWIHDHF